MTKNNNTTEYTVKHRNDGRVFGTLTINNDVTKDLRDIKKLWGINRLDISKVDQIGLSEVVVENKVEEIVADDDDNKQISGLKEYIEQTSFPEKFEDKKTILINDNDPKPITEKKTRKPRTPKKNKEVDKN